MTKRNEAFTLGESPADEPTTTLEQRIRERAYELYEQRGREDGFAEQDWLQAEAEMISSHTLKAVA